MKVRLSLIAVMSAAFVALGSIIPVRGGTQADVAVANWMQHRFTDIGAYAFTWIAWLGDIALTGLLIAAVAVLLYRRRWAAAVTMAIAGMGELMIEDALKAYFHRSRPEYAPEYILGTSFSFPSGHAMASMIGYGILAYFRRELESDPRRRTFIATTAALLIISVGISRLYLGVHYLTDVVGGFLAGGVWLLLCIEGYRSLLSQGFRRLDEWRSERRDST